MASEFTRNQHIYYYDFNEEKVRGGTILDIYEMDEDDYPLLEYEYKVHPDGSVKGYTIMVDDGFMRATEWEAVELFCCDLESDIKALERDLKQRQNLLKQQQDWLKQHHKGAHDVSEH